MVLSLLTGAEKLVHQGMTLGVTLDIPPSLSLDLGVEAVTIFNAIAKVKDLDEPRAVRRIFHSLSTQLD
eukprot:1294818-Rhodomonas_salina.2